MSNLDENTKMKLALLLIELDEKLEYSNNYEDSTLNDGAINGFEETVICIGGTDLLKEIGKLIHDIRNEQSEQAQESANGDI